MTVNKAIEAFKRSNIDIDESYHWLIMSCAKTLYDITYVHLDQSLKL